MRIGELAARSGWTSRPSATTRRRGSCPPRRGSTTTIGALKRGRCSACASSATAARSTSSLEEVRVLLAFIDRPRADCSPVDELVAGHLVHVRQRIASLRTLERQLEALHSACAHSGPTKKGCGMVREAQGGAARQAASRYAAARGSSRLISEVDDHVAAGPRAADEHVALGGGFERIGPVVDRSGDQSALAGVAHAGAARPAHGHVAGFGKLQQAAILRMPSGPRGCCVRTRPAARSRAAPGACGAGVRRRCRACAIRRSRTPRCGCASGGTPQAARPAVRSRMKRVGPQR